MNTKGDAPAFPCFRDQSIGLTKLEFFAAIAMIGCRSTNPSATYDDVATEAVCDAEALIAKLNSRKTP